MDTFFVTCHGPQERAIQAMKKSFAARTRAGWMAPVKPGHDKGWWFAMGLNFTPEQEVAEIKACFDRIDENIIKPTKLRQMLGLRP